MRPITLVLGVAALIFCRELLHVAREELKDFRLRRLEEEDEFMPEGWKPVPLARVDLWRRKAS